MVAYYFLPCDGNTCLHHLPGDILSLKFLPFIIPDEECDSQDQNPQRLYPLYRVSLRLIHDMRGSWPWQDLLVGQ